MGTFVPAKNKAKLAIAITPTMVNPANKTTKKATRNWVAFSLWWRRGESNPCPKTDPAYFLRAQSLLLHSLCRTVNDNIPLSVAS